MRLMLPLVAGLAMPITAAAHPHVFVEAQVTVVFAEDGSAAIKLDWYYDELFSLLVTTDLGIDMDGDLKLTAEERVRLETEIAAWPPDFAGDLDVRQGGALVPLAEKEGHAMRYEEGLFHEIHARPILAFLDADAPVQIRVFDPAFYTAYDLMRPVVIEGRNDCEAEIIPADLDAAYSLVESLTSGIDPNDLEASDLFPEVGDAFADTIVLTCAGQL